jgi:hypothetical protein
MMATAFMETVSSFEFQVATSHRAGDPKRSALFGAAEQAAEKLLRSSWKEITGAKAQRIFKRLRCG